MVITYKKANEKFKALENKWEGVRYGIGYAFRIGNRIVITHHNIPILWIDKQNKYEYISINNEAQRKFYNKYTPITIRKTKAGWRVGRMPFYVGLKVDSKGDMIIPEVWPSRNDCMDCNECGIVYTNHYCADCYEDYLEGSL